MRGELLHGIVQLKNGKRSKMVARKKIEIGQRFGRLVVLANLGIKTCNNGERSTVYKCQCDCGNFVEVKHKMLNGGHVKSCGCLKHEYQRIKSPFYKIKHRALLFVWKTMKQRCLTPTNKDYYLYGGRGITVCNEWKNDFFAFNSWAESNGYAKGLMLDRIDNNGNYCPENCRWATPIEQANNKRTNKWITLDNQTKTLKTWCNELNLPYSRTDSRLQKGWSVEEAFDIVPHTRKKVIIKSRRKPVIQFTINGDYVREWESMYDAAEELKCNPKYIKKTCRGEQKSYFGFVWKYKQ